MAKSLSDTVAKPDQNLKTNKLQTNTGKKPVTWDGTQLVERLVQNPQLRDAISKSASATLIITWTRSTVLQKSHNDEKHD